MEQTALDVLGAHTEVFDQEMDLVHPICWVVVDSVQLCTLEESPLSEINYYIATLDPDSERNPEVMSYEELPIEFFNHQLMECDEGSSESVLNFIKEWGMPFSPVRTDTVCDAGFDALRGKSSEGVIETDYLYSVEELQGSWIISEKEARSTIGLLKKVVEELRDYVVEFHESTGDPSSPEKREQLMRRRYRIGSVLNAGSCNPLSVGPMMNEQLHIDADIIPLSCLGLLTSAICNQIIESIGNKEVPWRKCACVGCNAVFKYQQSSARKPYADSYYCCVLHAERQRKRNNRKPR
ncbi:hypothetical protein [Anaerotardibacter muris]|uniref:hypothetical protein n=1 Tax=Anaerotardibacter muris TaxID=2941505 RepID=UPI00203CBBF9|nr:hypothetical protein [Anaerotardibacter muris]